jgi:hypothetical protein
VGVDGICSVCNVSALTQDMVLSSVLLHLHAFWLMYMRGALGAPPHMPSRVAPAAMPQGGSTAPQHLHTCTLLFTEQWSMPAATHPVGVALASPIAAPSKES